MIFKNLEIFLKLLITLSELPELNKINLKNSLENNQIFLSSKHFQGKCNFVQLDISQN